MQQSLSIPQGCLEAQAERKEKGLGARARRRRKSAWRADESGCRSDLHKEWCNKKNVGQSLEMDLVFRATIKPAYQRRISIHLGRALVFVVVSLRNGVALPGARISSN
jgi:hypothetical protein